MPAQDESSASILGALPHEFRQPIAAALLAVESAREALNHAERALLSASQRCTALDVLSWTLGGQLAPPMQPCIIAEALPAIVAPSDRFQLDVPADLAVLAWPGALETVLANLVSNARKYAKDTTVTISACALPAKEKPWPASAQVKLRETVVLLTVDDEGPGVSSNIRRQLFELGATTSKTGHGLGLFLSRLVVRAHGGDLWLDSRTQGASFSCVWRMAPRRRGV
jgi:two-component system sensor histidine kinase KdpD